jgi:hypothetical protein
MGYAYATSLAGTVVTTGAILGTGAVASRSASAGHDDMKTLYFSEMCFERRSWVSEAVQITEYKSVEIKQAGIFVGLAWIYG